MKMSKIVAISLSLASGSALAFQANDRAVSPSNPQLRSVESRLASYGYVSHGASLTAALTGTCSVNGCGCAFCTLMRSQ